MIAKEKAKELVDKFTTKFDMESSPIYYANSYKKEKAKQCSLICVDEILDYSENDRYWQDVKHEISLL